MAKQLQVMILDKDYRDYYQHYSPKKDVIVWPNIYTVSQKTSNVLFFK